MTIDLSGIRNSAEALDQNLHRMLQDVQALSPVAGQMTQAIVFVARATECANATTQLCEFWQQEDVTTLCGPMHKSLLLAMAGRVSYFQDQARKYLAADDGEP